MVEITVYRVALVVGAIVYADGVSLAQWGAGLFSSADLLIAFLILALFVLASRVVPFPAALPIALLLMLTHLAGCTIDRNIRPPADIPFTCRDIVPAPKGGC